jgi:hypothetical protein
MLPWFVSQFSSVVVLSWEELPKGNDINIISVLLFTDVVLAIQSAEVQLIDKSILEFLPCEAIDIKMLLVEILILF